MATYLFNVKTFAFFFFLRCSSFDKKGGVGLFLIGPLLHLIPPEVTLNSTEPAWGPCYMAPGRTQQKTPAPTVLSLLLWEVA
jgi:hypothetical protein